jgi:hypothetical protein
VMLLAVEYMNDKRHPYNMLDRKKNRWEPTNSY